MNTKCKLYSRLAFQTRSVTNQGKNHILVGNLCRHKFRTSDGSIWCVNKAAENLRCLNQLAHIEMMRKIDENNLETHA